MHIELKHTVLISIGAFKYIAVKLFLTTNLFNLTSNHSPMRI